MSHAQPLPVRISFFSLLFFFCKVKKKKLMRIFKSVDENLRVPILQPGTAYILVLVVADPGCVLQQVFGEFAETDAAGSSAYVYYAHWSQGSIILIENGVSSGIGLRPAVLLSQRSVVAFWELAVWLRSRRQGSDVDTACISLHGVMMLLGRVRIDWWADED